MKIKPFHIGFLQWEKGRSVWNLQSQPTDYDKLS